MIKTLKNLFKQDKEKFTVPIGAQDIIPVKTIYGYCGVYYKQNRR